MKLVDLLWYRHLQNKMIELLWYKHLWGVLVDLSRYTATQVKEVRLSDLAGDSDIFPISTVDILCNMLPI